ncbi:hypothetical protein J6590_003428 [Homalodisca vitripennis]|nr:hypothetical protein J6590_003428 [Homalodisca vitripennis]
MNNSYICYLKKTATTNISEYNRRGLEDCSHNVIDGDWLYLCYVNWLCSSQCINHCNHLVPDDDNYNKNNLEMLNV